MKRMILSALVVAFAVAVQAGDGKSCCASKTQTSTQAQTSEKSDCCASKVKTSLQAQGSEKSDCCASKTKTSLQAETSEQSGSCGSKVKTSLETSEGTCPFAKAACCKKKAVKQTALLSPKAAELLR